MSWVSADPGGERGIDALGLGAQADKIADRLVPDLSGGTSRARYFSFLCWAVKRAEQTTTPLTSIHRLEAEHALEEAELHDGQSSARCPGIVGRQSASSYLASNNGAWPKRPDRLYKSTAFATYRPAMRAIGLLRQTSRPTLTPAGERLAEAFKMARGSRPRCLGDLGSAERTQLCVLLGLDYRKQGTLSSSSTRRRNTFEAISALIAKDRDINLLEQFKIPVGPGVGVRFDLHRAFVWELISSGLLLAFAMLVKNKKTSAVTTSLKISPGAKRPVLSPMSGHDDEAGKNVVALLRAGMKLTTSEMAFDPAVIRLCSHLVTHRAPDQFVEALIARHSVVKADGPWLALSKGTIRPLVHAKLQNLAVRPRSYRLNAYAQLLTDLRMIK